MKINRPIETDLGKRASPAWAAAHGRHQGPRLLQRVSTRVKSVAAVAVEATALVGSAGGAALAMAFGKALLAVVLGAIALGVFLRLSSRRRGTLAAERQAPVWVAPTIALASTVEAALLVEAVDLPVRLSQPGFHYYHWLIVLAFLVVAYAAQSRLMRRLLVKSRQHQEV
ncbi:MAG: hypothetical protein WA210_18420 [Burkholderiaceae bacterium]